MGKVFVSYRREDSADVTGRICDWLCARFGAESVFKDVDNIPLGHDFREHISAGVASCQSLIAVIGRQWLTVTDISGEKRLEDERDFVRIEIESALRRGIPVIPVLVQGVSMPRPEDLPAALKPLAFRQGTSVRPDPDFRRDMERLIRSLGACLEIERPESAAGPSATRVSEVAWPKPTASLAEPWTARSPSILAPERLPPARYALCLERKGEGARVPQTPMFALTAVTFEAWLIPSVIEPFDVVFANNTAWDDGFGIDFNPDRKIRFFFNQWATASHSVVAEIPLGQWSHIAATYDGAFLRLFVNGKLADEREPREPVRYAAPPTTTLAVTSWRKGTYQFYGCLAEVRIWDLARDQRAIAATMHSQLLGNEDGLVAYYSVDDTVAAGGALLIDRSEHAHHAMLIGSPRRLEVTRRPSRA